MSSAHPQKKTWRQHARSNTADLSNHQGLLRDHGSWGNGRQRSATVSANPQPSAPADAHDMLNIENGGPHYQKFVLSDPVAFSYLEEDPSTNTIERSHVLQGYQSYIVEQWVVSRAHPTFMITAFTGDSIHKVTVGVLSVPADEESWSPRLKVYFKSLAQYNAKRKETPVGTLMVTNIAGFPSSLTLVAVPGGDVKKHREDFFVNENLKRLGCMGRSGMSLGRPTGPTQAKFHQLFKISDKIDFYTAVIDLVKLCQAALMVFDRLEPEYADGLLCDITERAFHEWWDEIGADLYNIEPKDGIVSPTTVAALLGTLIGARNRLHAYGAPVGKDVFDIEATKRAINYFQKSQHLPKSRRLDRNTLMKLHKVTAKQANADGWGVPRAVKSTVAELSGKGGEMVMEMVGRDKASLADVETTNIERFAHLVKGERAKWLWQGKARKRKTEDIFAEYPGQLSGRAKAHLGEPLDSGDDAKSPATPMTPRSAPNSARDAEVSKLAMWKRPARFARNAGRRAHHASSSEDVLTALSNNKSIESVMSDAKSGSEERPENFFEERRPSERRHTHRFGNKKDLTRLPHMQSAFKSSRSNLATPRGTSLELSRGADDSQRLQAGGAEEETIVDLSLRPSQVVRNQLATADAVFRETEFDAGRQLYYQAGEHTGVLLRRSVSFTRYLQDSRGPRNIESYPRHLSFSAAEDVIARADDGWQDLDLHTGEDEGNDEYAPDAGPRNLDFGQSLERELLLASRAKEIRAQLATKGTATGAWVLDRLRILSDLERILATDAEQLATLHAPRQEQHDTLNEASHEVVTIERGRIQDAIRDVETLGQRLEYEIDGLRDKVEDVESAVAEFEKQVVFTEERVAELVRDGAGPAAGNPGGDWGWLESVLGGRGKEMEARQRRLEQELTRDLGIAVRDTTGVETVCEREEGQVRAKERDEQDEEEYSTLFSETRKHLRAMLQAGT